MNDDRIHWNPPGFDKDETACGCGGHYYTMYGRNRRNGYAATCETCRERFAFHLRVVHGMNRLEDTKEGLMRDLLDGKIGFEDVDKGWWDAVFESIAMQVAERLKDELWEERQRWREENCEVREVQAVDG